MLLGERGYVREHRGAVLQAPRILLHAAELGFQHPVSQAAMQFEIPMPEDMAAVVQSLRA
jgi:23S rRNA pseudouridine1911/1915/1917 synthase